LEQTAPMMKATLTFGSGFAFFAAAVGAQAQQDNFREIGSEHADKTELLSCSVRSDVPDSAYVYFAETNHFAGFHEGSVNDGRIVGTRDAVVTSTTVTWKSPSLTPGAKEETFSLDRKTGALEADATYPALPATYPCIAVKTNCIWLIPVQASPANGSTIPTTITFVTAAIQAASTARRPFASM